MIVCFGNFKVVILNSPFYIIMFWELTSFTKCNLIKENLGTMQSIWSFIVPQKKVGKFEMTNWLHRHRLETNLMCYSQKSIAWLFSFAAKGGVNVTMWFFLSITNEQISLDTERYYIYIYIEVLTTLIFFLC